MSVCHVLLDVVVNLRVVSDFLWLLYLRSRNLNLHTASCFSEFARFDPVFQFVHIHIKYVINAGSSLFQRDGIVDSWVEIGYFIPPVFRKVVNLYLHLVLGSFWGIVALTI